jgi:hypothetical protein
MCRLLRSVIGLILSLACVSASFAQAKQEANSQPPTLTITAFASTERVRFTAPSSIVQMRLEVYDAAGRKLFDNELKGGNVLDWHLQDGQAARLPNATYLCVVTVKSRSGRLIQRLGAVLVEQGSASMQAATAAQLTAPQAAAVGPVEEQSALSVVNEDETQTATVIAHNGEEGQLVRGRGALSFRLGDLFSGKDREQMRLTQDGKLGIGVADPQAKLDVAGAIRTSEGIVFPDGTVQTTAYVASGRSLRERSRVQRDAQGRSVVEQDKSGRAEPEARLAPEGTFNRLAKFANDQVNLVDSGIIDVGGNVGIGVATPQSNLDYKGSLAPFFTRDVGTTNFGTAQSALQLGLSNLGSRNAGVGPSFLFYAENSAGNKSFLGRVSSVWENPTAGAEAGAIFFQVRANSGDTAALTERMRITAAGNVGIGTPIPTRKLHVIGSAGQPAIYGETDNRGVWGKSTGSSYGVYGESVNGIGVQGVSTNNIGTVGGSTNNIGVYGSTAAGGYATPGVLGVSSAADGIGVRGNGAYGVYGVSSGSNQAGVYGEANVGSSAGVYGVGLSATTIGVFASNPTGMALGVAGNATQSFDKGGLVKAMILVRENGHVIRCYNSTRPDGGASLPPSGNTGCGFSVTTVVNEFGSFRYVTFDFPAGDRFWSATYAGSVAIELPVNNVNVGIEADGIDNTIAVRMFLTDEREGTDVFRKFMLIVY